MIPGDEREIWRVRKFQTWARLRALPRSVMPIRRVLLSRSFPFFAVAVRSWASSCASVLAMFELGCAECVQRYLYLFKTTSFD
jgi:hypothetical protein